MKIIFCTILSVLILSFTPNNLLWGNEVKVEPIPSWVHDIRVQTPVDIPTSEISQGFYFLLYDEQTLVNRQETIHFRHYAEKVLNEKGMESAGQIHINFDPAYQHVKIHHINILRGEKCIDLAQKVSINLIQRETLLEYQLYDGSKTAYIVLEDIRVNDIVEYSYSLTGSNPVFKDKFIDDISLQWSVPVHVFSSRLLWPKDRNLYIKNHNTDFQPAKRDIRDFHEYLWQKEKISALILDRNVPDFFNPYPWVQLSEFCNWEDVLKWAAPMYQVPDEISPELEIEIQKIAFASKDPHRRAFMALEFIQNKIRYLGLEVGPGSHAPNNPSLVFKRRFGDCKDKALLFTTILNKVGIESYPALVNTEHRRMIAKWHASPLAFDHVIVRIKINDMHYWVDPTRQGQKGTLQTIFKPDYEMALVISPAETDLVTFAQPKFRYIKEIKDVFDLRDGTGTPAKYQLETSFQGLSAELMRQSLLNNSRAELEKEYLNFLSRYYPSIVILKPYEIRDLPEENKLILTEFYTIPNLWQNINDEPEDFEANFYPVDFMAYAELPDDTVRTMPLYINRGTKLTQKTKVFLPEKWNVKNNKEDIKDPAFHFHRDIKYADKVLEINYSYKTRAEQVAVQDLEKYMSNLRLMDDNLGYRVLDRKSLEKKLDKTISPIWFIGIGAILFFTSLAVLAYRYDPHPLPKYPSISDPKLVGIKGWLFYYAIGLCLTPFRIVLEFAQTISAYSASNWEALTNSAMDSYHFLWAPILVLEITGNSFLFISYILLIVLFFQKRRTFPNLFIAVAFINLFIIIMDVLLAGHIPAAKAGLGEGYVSLVRQIIFSGIWILYFFVSKRVQATFTCQRKPIASLPTQIEDSELWKNNEVHV